MPGLTVSFTVGLFLAARLPSFWWAAPGQVLRHVDAGHRERIIDAITLGLDATAVCGPGVLALCSWGFPENLTENMGKPQQICVYIYTHNTYAYIYIYMHMYMHMYTWVSVCF